MSFNIFNWFKSPKKAAAALMYEPHPEPMPVANKEVKLVPSQGIETTHLRNIIEAIILKHKPLGIDVFKPATPDEIAWFEQQIGFPLPADFKEFYSICNGFGCNEDIFNMTPLREISNSDEDKRYKGLYFSEYMINSDWWGLRLTAEGKYEIFNGSFPAIAMTDSLVEFLTRFLKGNVFEDGGLYAWQEDLGIGK